MASFDSQSASTVPDELVFRSGSWLHKGLALAMVVAFAVAVTLYWEPYRTGVGLVGVVLLVGMAAACAIWWRVRVDAKRRTVTRLATLVGVLPVWRRRVAADRMAAVRLEGHRRARRWHDVWYLKVIEADGRATTLDWGTHPRGEEPTEMWERAQRLGRMLNVSVENKGIRYTR